MWTEKLKNGKVKFVDRYMDEMTGKYKRVSVVMEKENNHTRKLAEKAIAEKIKRKMHSINEITVKELVERYIEDQRVTVKQSTYDRNRIACNTIMKILGENVMVDKLTAGYIRKAMLATGKKPGTLNEYIARLKSLIRWGYHNDLIKSTECIDKMERFKDIPHRQKIEDKFLESEEVAKILESMKHQEWKDLTEFLVLSGLRFGEAAALLRTDVDFEERVIHVTKNYDSIHDLVTTPKTRTSIRDVYMQDELYRLCRRIMVRTESDVIVHLNSVGLLFPGNNGKHAQFFAYNKYLKETANKAIGREITPHTLRHTHASLMMENGMDVDSISRRLGHTNSKVTREIYLHVTEKMKQREREKINNIKIL